MTQALSMARGYPMQNAVAAALHAFTGGLPGGFGQVWARPWMIYHIVDFPNDGLTIKEFFTDSRQKHYTNLDKPNALPANYGFGLTGIRVKFTPGFDRDGKRSTVSGTASDTHLSRSGASATDTIIDKIALWHESVRLLLETGLLTLTIAERPVFEVQGLTNFPEGGGVSSSGALSQALDGATGAVGVQGAVTQIGNGAPFVGNVFHLQDPYPIMPEQQFSVRIEWPTAVDFTDSSSGPLNGETAGNPAGRLKVEMLGKVFSPGSA